MLRNPAPKDWQNLEPWQMTSDEFVDTLNLYSGRKFLEDYDEVTKEDFNYVKRSRRPILIDLWTIKTPAGQKLIEVRQSGEKLQYVAHDENGDIARTSDGELIYMSDEELLAKNIALYDISIYLFDGEEAIGYIGDEWGGTLIKIAKEYQRFGLGTRLYKYFLKKHPYRCSGGFTQAGIKLAKKVHRSFVLDALDEGKCVPQKVIDSIRSDRP